MKREIGAGARGDRVPPRRELKARLNGRITMDWSGGEDEEGRVVWNQA